MLKFLLVIAVFAVAVYVTLWLLERRRAAGTGGTPRRRRGRSARPQTKQVAPDDDDDFLRWLDRKRRKDSSPDE